MTSSDGINWIKRNVAIANLYWSSVCWSSELKLFCAVANSGADNRQIMTSHDGITWVAYSDAVPGFWQSVCWSPKLDKFCSVSRGVITSKSYRNYYTPKEYVEDIISHKELEIGSPLYNSLYANNLVWKP
jgi:hypothetical protein